MIRGGAGPDRIKGGAGDDRIRGGEGADVLLAGPGDDEVQRGPGDHLGDFQVTFIVDVRGAKDHAFTIRQGSEAFCTKDPTRGTYTPDSDDFKLALVMTVRVFADCFAQRPVNTWQFSAAGEDLGEIKGHQNWLEWVWECQPGIWPRAKCAGDADGIDVIL